MGVSFLDLDFEGQTSEQKFSSDYKVGQRDIYCSVVGSAV